MYVRFRGFAGSFCVFVCALFAASACGSDPAMAVDVTLSPQDGPYDGTLTIEPFTSIARAAGFRVLDSSSQLFDSYQGGVVATTRAFAAAHPERVRGFLRAYLKGLEWVLHPENREAATALLAAQMPDIRPQAMAAVMDSLLSPRSGLTPGGAILPEGMRTVLDLRSRHGGGGTLTDIERYLDLSHFAATGAGS